MNKIVCIITIFVIFWGCDFSNKKCTLYKQNGEKIKTETMGYTDKNYNNQEVCYPRGNN